MRYCLLLASLSLLAALAPRAATLPMYSLLDLGATHMTPDVQDVYVNDLGQVAFPRHDGVFRYTEGVGLERIAPYARRVGGINNRGQVSLATADAVMLYSDGTGLTQVGTGVGIAAVKGPNSRGDVAFGDETDIIYHSAAGNRHLLDLTRQFGQYGCVTDLNDAGVVDGGTVLNMVAWVPALLAADGATPTTSPLRHVSGLNNRGDVLGVTADRGPMVRWADGRLTGLPGYGRDLNESGTITGLYSDVYRQFPWVMDATGWSALDALVDPSLGLTFASASGINNLGQISGTAWLNGEAHAYRLTPTTAIPEPGALALLAPAMARLLLPSARAVRRTR